MKIETPKNGGTMPKNKLMSTKQAAEQWNISRWAIYDLVKDGKLRPIVVGSNSRWKWQPDDLENANILTRI